MPLRIFGITFWMTVRCMEFIIYLSASLPKYLLWIIYVIPFASHTLVWFCMFWNHSRPVSDKNLVSFCHKDSKGVFSSSPFPSDPMAISVPPKTVLLYFIGCPCLLLLLLGSLPCLTANSAGSQGISRAYLAQNRYSLILWNVALNRWGNPVPSSWPK